jgi:hypothetical protein
MLSAYSRYGSEFTRIEVRVDSTAVNIRESVGSAEQPLIFYRISEKIIYGNCNEE